MAPGAERRFNEQEVATILERAAAKYERTSMVPSGDGLTLAQLQDVGREVGIDPRVVAEMASSLDDTTTVKRTFGLPLRVERRVTLTAPLSDADWERVVVDLREIFEARGVVKRDGSLRQWTNGNLQALLEPTANGQRLRIRTFKGDAVPMLTMGSIFMAVSAMGITALTLNATAEILPVYTLAFIGSAGAVAVAGTALRLRGWARRRREQMAELAGRLASLGG